MKKQTRQQLIKQAIFDHHIARQSDLVDYLNAHGQQVTQATVSRDIRELKLVKVNDAQGQTHYEFGQKEFPEKPDQAFVNLLIDAKVQASYQDKLICLQTLPGSGPVVAAALKQKNWPEVFAVLGDDDRVLLILKQTVTSKTPIWQLLTQSKV